MSHHEKVESYLLEMKSRGVKPGLAAPPLFRLLWMLGFSVRPPLFMTRSQLTVVMGLFFGVTMTIFFAVMLRWIEDSPSSFATRIPSAAVPGAIGGLVFGMVMARVFRTIADRLDLPRWEDYGTAARTTPAMRST